MSSIIQSDIFFFITSIAIVIVTILLAVALLYAIRVLHNIKKFSNRAIEEGDEIIRDLKDARKSAREKGGQIATALGMFGRMFFRGRKGKKKNTSSSSKESTVE